MLSLSDQAIKVGVVSACVSVITAPILLIINFFVTRALAKRTKALTDTSRLADVKLNQIHLLVNSKLEAVVNELNIARAYAAKLEALLREYSRQVNVEAAVLDARLQADEKLEAAVLEARMKAVSVDKMSEIRAALAKDSEPKGPLDAS